MRLMHLKRTGTPIKTANPFGGKDRCLRGPNLGHPNSCLIYSILLATSRSCLPGHQLSLTDSSVLMDSCGIIAYHS